MKLRTVALAAIFALSAGSSWAAYTDKSIHDAGDDVTYKHPNQKSYTGPFDYAPEANVERAIVPSGRCNCFTFDATKSHDIDGQKLTVNWDFGDGSTSDKAVVQKCYDKAGDYSVTLTVKDSSGLVCDSGVAKTRVNPAFPPVAVAGEDASACLGQAVSFDASGSTASGATKYTWNFGDGTSGEGVRVSHSYEKPGSYRVVLLMDDGRETQCSKATDWLTANIASSVSVDLTGPEATCTGRSVAFSAAGTGGARYHWDFGDGSTWDGGSKASHVYQKGGNYTVSVTADNGQGFPCSTASDSLRIRVNGSPIADAGQNLVCCVGQSTVFDGSNSSDPDGDKLTYRWDFGDGTTGDSAKTNHTYEKSGTYRVTLAVSDASDNECGSSMDSFTAVVNTSPEAVIEVR